jgi:hypothetical protein
VRPDRVTIVTYCGPGEAAVRWHDQEMLDDAVTRGVRKLYPDRSARVSGDWRIIGSDQRRSDSKRP